MRRIGIVGLGGLATSFVNFYEHKAKFWATSRNKDRFDQSLRERVELFHYQLGGSFKHLPMKDTEDILFTIPPSASEDYVAQTTSFFREVLNINPSLRIIFISSTSVYGEQNKSVDERSFVKPETSNAKKLRAVELFLENYNVWILRCGGLIGDRKHPVHYLAKRELIPTPQAAVNLVHEHDICRFIKLLLENDIDFGIYNLVAPEHPSRKEYYSEVARRLGLNPLKFDEEDQRKGKIVLPKRALSGNFSFEYSSPFEMPFN